MTIDPMHFAILIFVVFPAVVLGAAAANEMLNRIKQEEEDNDK